jgi:hypothetical protein
MFYTVLFILFLAYLHIWFQVTISH